MNPTAQPEANASSLTSPPPSDVQPQRPSPSRTASGLAQPRLPTIDDTASTVDLTPTPSEFRRSSEKYVESRESNPCSPFYLHPTTRYSFEMQKSESKAAIDTYEVDLEHGPGISSVRLSRPASKVPCSVWPGKATSRPVAKGNGKGDMCSKKRRWNPMRGLTKRTKIMLKILIALVILGAAIGIGIGISKAVGAGVWKNNNSSQPIGKGSSRRSIQ